MNEDIFKTLEQVIGSPEKNREILLRTLFLDMNMTCKGCNLTYATKADLEQLDVSNHDPNPSNPESMTVYLTCHCGHSGTYTFRPNPFVVGAI